MQKLHLVGFTTDHEGLILSARRGARSGSYSLTIDDALEEAVDERRARREEEPDHDDAVAGARRTRVESALPVREIQARLRQGRSIAEVARAAGVDADWVDRFAPPILAERAQVIRKVRSVPLRRARLGPSVLPIGDAVRHHLADRGISHTPDEFAAAWSARQVAEGRWAVRFTFHHRGHDQVLRFDLDDSTGEVSTADRASSLMGYVAPRTSAPTATSAERQRPAKPAPEERPIAKRAVVSTGFRPDPTTKAVSRSAKERERAAVAMR
ncbi:MAG: septation protein SepH, partial [Acidimicrobiales bacterium]